MVGKNKVDKVMTKVVNSNEEGKKADGGRTRDNKYREFCEGMRQILEKYPQEQKNMGGLMRLVNGIIQDTRKMAARKQGRRSTRARTCSIAMIL
jgi:hypothetical protein